MSDRLWQWSLTDLVQALRAGEVSAREVVQSHLARIEAVNPAVRALPVVLRERALHTAAEADAAYARGESTGPLHGVPFTIKANVDLAGSATSAGVPALKDAVAAQDAPHVAQLIHAGAIPLARGNLPDFGFRWHTDSALYGATFNPWNAGLTPGGSSGGEAAALATGMTPLGLGNDFGGSLRYPAFCCGVAALRPSLGRVARAAAPAGAEPPISFQMFSVQGPMARHVRDLRLALAHMCGLDARDPWWVPAPLDGVSAKHPLRVAYCADPLHNGVHPQVAAALGKAARSLEQAGYRVEEIAPPGAEEALDVYLQIVSADVRTSLLSTVSTMASEDTQRFVADFLTLVSDSTLEGYVTALAQRNRIARDWFLFQQDYPLLLAPVSTAPPFAVGFDVSGVDAVATLLRSMGMTIAVNLLGLPAAAVPTGVVEGIPLGVQLVSARYREDLCLQAAEHIECALGVATPIEPNA